MRRLFGYCAAVGLALLLGAGNLAAQECIEGEEGCEETPACWQCFNLHCVADWKPGREMCSETVWSNGDLLCYLFGDPCDVEVAVGSLVPLMLAATSASLPAPLAEAAESEADSPGATGGVAEGGAADLLPIYFRRDCNGYVTERIYSPAHIRRLEAESKRIRI